MADKPEKRHLLATLQHTSEPLMLAELISASGIQIPDRTARRWLSLWIDEGIVLKQGANKGTRYQYVEKRQLPDYLRGLDKDIQQRLVYQIRDLWTHNSTALEGNALTLGDTQFLLGQGLTISGKPLKDHQEVIGHAQAIDIIYAMLEQPVTKEHIFDLHRAVQTEHAIDIYKPNGAWKLEINGTYTVDSDGKQVFIEYAYPIHVDALMAEVIGTINHNKATTRNAHKVYAKIHMGIVHIHPFWDGNGRIARLLANVPLLSAGLPPIVISQNLRREYIDTLAAYQLSLGILTAGESGTGVWPKPNSLKPFEAYCRSSYEATQSLLDAAFALQDKRKK